jgi:hypothetical protein
MTENTRSATYITTLTWLVYQTDRPLLLNIFQLYSAFGTSLCTYKRCWKRCPRASIQAWSRLISFANTFCRSAFVKSLCTYKRCWKWCPCVSIQAWTLLILFANTFCRSAYEMFLMNAVSKNWIKQLNTLPVLHFNCCLTTEYSETTAHFNGNFDTTKSTYRSLRAQRLSERTAWDSILNMQSNPVTMSSKGPNKLCHCK